MDEVNWDSHEHKKKELEKKVTELYKRNGGQPEIEESSATTIPLQEVMKLGQKSMTRHADTLLALETL